MCKKINITINNVYASKTSCHFSFGRNYAVLIVHMIALQYSVRSEGFSFISSVFTTKMAFSNNGKVEQLTRRLHIQSLNVTQTNGVTITGEHTFFNPIWYRVCQLASSLQIHHALLLHIPPPIFPACSVLVKTE